MSVEVIVVDNSLQNTNVKDVWSSKDLFARLRRGRLLEQNRLAGTARIVGEDRATPRSIMNSMVDGHANGLVSEAQKASSRFRRRLRADDGRGTV